MLLIEGNIEDTARENVSPMSLFCVNFGLTMMDRDTEAVVLFFFCGLHTDYTADNWAGPNGMLRSLIVQLLISILQQKCPELDLSNTDYVRQLAALEMETLANLFEDLLNQFDEKDTIYCIVDGVSRFDVHAGKCAQYMWFIVQRLQSMSHSDYLGN
ncbi:hypothetical protein COL516b_010531 [Colletotrichum fioriniae]|nr:uncharacterized protein COL516b_010531 [Colletotrichum fioriniae]KAJ0297677.1 hypothetical protein COL516b_010531 [Colletotrichum fioriniae]